MDKHKISISFSREYEELYNYLKDMPNRSNFICQMLKKNLNIDNIETNNLEEIIEKAVIRALEKHSNISINYRDVVREDEISDADRELINNLF